MKLFCNIRHFTRENNDIAISACMSYQLFSINALETFPTSSTNLQIAILVAVYFSLKFFSFYKDYSHSVYQRLLHDYFFRFFINFIVIINLLTFLTIRQIKQQISFSVKFLFSISSAIDLPSLEKKHLHLKSNYNYPNTFQLKFSIIIFCKNIRLNLTI
jgi:hypothetical protein